MRRDEPRGVKLRVRCFDLFVAARLPGAIVDIVEVIECLGFKTAGLGNSGTSGDAPSHWARVDRSRAPSGRDVLGHSVCLGTPAVRQRQIGSSTKSFGCDAFDMAVAGQKNLSHRQTPGSMTIPAVLIDPKVPNCPGCRGQSKGSLGTRGSARTDQSSSHRLGRIVGRMVNRRGQIGEHCTLTAAAADLARPRPAFPDFYDRQIKSGLRFPPVVG
jgi:hypothetical protein